MVLRTTLVSLLTSCLWVCHAPVTLAQTTESPSVNRPKLHLPTANAWAQLVLKGAETEFPNKLSLLYTSSEQIQRPRDHFPAFYGCYDWHSSVHGHWVLARLLRYYPEIESAEQVRDLLNRHLTAENLNREAEFFGRDEQKTFERMYGWAWLLRLVTELDDWDDPDATRWRHSLRPLEQVLVRRVEGYLPLLTYPIRVGQHDDTAFALGQILDYARATGQQELEGLVIERANDFYLDDRDYPVHYEPSGNDFFSSCWNEADLMRRVLPQTEYVQWFERFLPQLAEQLKDRTILPVTVSDMSDPKLVHLAGLNLHRAWCMQSVAAALPADHHLRTALAESGRAHLAAGLAYINSGHYEGDHWLATFGLYGVERVGIVGEVLPHSPQP